jgi:hypothetical protein
MARRETNIFGTVLCDFLDGERPAQKSSAERARLIHARHALLDTGAPGCGANYVVFVLLRILMGEVLWRVLSICAQR